MAEIQIGGKGFDAYANVTTADEYLSASFTATAWRAEADVDQKGRALVEASRLIDRQVWAGAKSDELQSAAWPRSGIDGVDEYAVPDAVVAATCELASAFIDGQTDVLSNPSTTNNVRSLQAGSVGIEYFFPSAATAARFPLIIQELLGVYLLGAASSSTLGFPSASGVDGCSSFNRGLGFNRPI